MKQFVWRHVPALVVSAGLALVGVGAAWAEATTTSTTGNWNDAIWTMGVPEAGDTVTLAHNVTLTNTTPVCGSITLNAGKTLTFNGTNTALKATNIVLYGTVTHDANTDTNGTPGVYGDWAADSRIWIVGTNLSVAAGSVINADGKGYAGGGKYGPGSGPGGGSAPLSADGAGGGGYGGVGGTFRATVPGGITYGSTNAPTDPGSGGGGADQGVAGNGGGYVRLDVAGHIIINGTVTANGNTSPNWRSAGGSGGGILINCLTLASTNGLVTANGGNVAGNKTDGAGGGGGGRIAILYDPVAQTNLSSTASLQIAANDGCGQAWGRPGTIYLPDTSVYPITTLRGGQLLMPGFTAWAPDSLSVTDGLAVFPAEFRLTVTNNVTVTGIGGIELSNGVFTVGGNLRINNDKLLWGATWHILARSRFYAWTGSTFHVNGNMTLDEGQLHLFGQGTNALVWSVGGDLIATNDARLYVYSAATNDTTANWGAQVTVASNLVVGGGTLGSWIYPSSDPTNGGAPLFQARNVSLLATNSGFYASSLGFLGGTNRMNGWGPGGGKSRPVTGNYGGGGGYGGAGGTAPSGATGGVAYGSATAPVDSGSGGGGCDVNGLTPAGAGGGVVRIEATRTAMVNGQVRADGGNGPTTRSGGGSGGSVYLRCRTLTTSNAWLSANGGGGAVNDSGGGGGGRVAVWRSFDQTNGGHVVTAAGATNKVNPAAPGTNGTIVWGGLPAVPLVDNAGGATGITVTTAWLNGMVTSTGTAETTVSVFWGTSDGSTNRAAWDHTNDFPGLQTEGVLLSTNVSGLNTKTTYYYRFHATNSAGEFWAEAPAPFMTPPGIPVISNAVQGATNITLSSAVLNGELLSTGTAATVVSVFWGPTDGGTNAAAWANTNNFDDAVPASFSTNVDLSSSDVNYYYTFYASNSEGEAWAVPSSYFLCGSVWAEATDNVALEKGPGKTGTFTLYRSDGAAITNQSLTVNYQAGGTATPDMDYDALSGTIIMPQGATSATVTVTPLMDAVTDDGETVTLTLLAGLYVVGSPSNATVTITDVAPAPTNTWTGSGLWTSRTNWSDEMIPAAGQNVVISGTSTSPVSPAPLMSLTIAAGHTLVVDDWNVVVTADDVRVSGTVTHNPNTDIEVSDGWTPDQRVHIVCTNLTVNAGGKIDVSRKGYAGGVWTGPGRGPGGGTYAFQCGSGGGYGGEGGRSTTAGGTPYGEEQAPGDPGSGGGGSDDQSPPTGGAGGPGGGVVRIEAANNVMVNGSIRADGYLSGYWRPGSGSGGSVYITCRTFSSTGGVITADGGDGPGNGSDAGGGGGGGRIALIYDPAAQSASNAIAKPVIKLSAKNGFGGVQGHPGTLYLPDSGFYPCPLIYGGRIVIPGFTNWALDGLTIAEGMACFTNGFRLTVSNDLNITGLGGIELTNGILDVGGNVTIQNTILYWSSAPIINARTFLVAGPAASYVVGGNFNLTGGKLYLNGVGTNPLILTVNNNLTFTNYARVYVQSGVTNAGGPGYGALLNVANTMLIGDQSWVYPLSDNTNGGSPLFRMGNLTVSTTNSGFNADSAGFRGGHAGHYLGYGPGYGTSYGTGSGGGGGYGGSGGTYGGGAGGVTYGSSNAPVDPGSGGGALATGGRGGGLVRIDALNALTLNGTLTANGGSEGTWHEGAGSGGGIYVRAKTFSGNAGTLSANGGSGEAGSSGGGGGGGRIAICASYLATSGVWQVSAVQGAGGSGAGDGTIVWSYVALPGTLFVVH